MSRYYNDYISHSSGPWKKHQYLKKIGNGPKAIYVYARDQLAKAGRSIKSPSTRNNKVFQKRQAQGRAQATKYFQNAKSRYRAAALRAKKKANTTQAKQAVESFLNNTFKKKKSYGSGSASSEEKSATSKKKKSSKSKKKSSGRNRKSSSKSKSSGSSASSSKSKSKVSKQVKNFTEKTKVKISQIEDDDADVKNRTENDWIPDTNFYLFRGEDGHFVLTDSDSTKWDLPRTVNITDDNKAEIANRLKTITGAISDNIDNFQNYSSDTYEKAVMYAFRGEMDKANELVTTGKISRKKKSSSVAHSDDLVERWMMSRYYNDDYIEHSSGPWKKHKYISKRGSGPNAVYIYDKKAGNAIQNTLGDPDLEQKVKNKIDEGDRRGENLDRQVSNWLRNTYNSAKRNAHQSIQEARDAKNSAKKDARRRRAKNAKDAKRASKQISEQQYAADRKTKNTVRSAKRKATQSARQSVNETKAAKKYYTNKAKNAVKTQKDKDRAAHYKYLNQQNANNKKFKKSVKSTSRKVNNKINQGQRYGENLDHKATKKIQNGYNSSKRSHAAREQKANQINQQRMREQQQADDYARSIPKRAKKSYKQLKKIWR